MKVKYEIMRKDGLIEPKILEHVTRIDTIDNNGIKLYYNLYHTVRQTVESFTEIWPEEQIFKMEIIP